MRWIVGIDLHERSHGAVHMAAWLRAHHRGASPAEFIAVHVVDERCRDSAKVMSEVVAAGERALATVAEQCGVPSPFSDLRVVLAPSAEQGLADAALGSAVDGVLIGRIAPGSSPGLRLVRLGSVARRLLRHLPVPVLVVPPDLVGDGIGSGAIVLATDLGPTSLAAGRVAARFASDLGRELVAAYLDPDVDIDRDVSGSARYGVTAGFLHDPNADIGRDAPGHPSSRAAWIPRHTPAEVDQWAHAHQIPVARTRFSSQSVVEGLLDEARREQAPVLVCGSRQLSTLDRVFTSSIGSDLARLADRAVLVVPSA